MRIIKSVFRDVLNSKGILSLLFFCLMQIHCFAQNIGLVDIRSNDHLITVGGQSADVPGFKSGTIQIALDALRTRGGGVVRLNRGIYNVIGPVRHQKIE
jgi:hypothetical protein